MGWPPSATGTELPYHSIFISISNCLSVCLVETCLSVCLSVSSVEASQSGAVACWCLCDPLSTGTELLPSSYCWLSRPPTPRRHRIGAAANFQRNSSRCTTHVKSWRNILEKFGGDGKKVEDIALNKSDHKFPEKQLATHTTHWKCCNHHITAADGNWFSKYQRIKVSMDIK